MRIALTPHLDLLSNKIETRWGETRPGLILAINLLRVQSAIFLNIFAIFLASKKNGGPEFSPFSGN